MLASRSLRFLASHCRPAPLYTWSMKTRAPMAVHTATTWYVRPPSMTAAYSKDSKNVFTSSFLIKKRLNSTTAPATGTITTPIIIKHPSQLSTPSPQTSNNASESSSDKEPPKTPPPVKSSPLGKSADSCNISSKSSSSSPPSTTFTDKCSKISTDSPIQPPNIKLPNRDQVEKLLFTALVYVWDFCYYVFCLTIKLIDTYILKNPTLQENWKKLTKRLDEQRQAIKSKK